MFQCALGLNEDRSLLRPSALSAQAVKITNDILRNTGLPGLFRSRGLSPLGPDQGKLARIEPVASAVWALVHFDTASGAKEMSMELHPGAAGTFTFAGLVHS